MVNTEEKELRNVVADLIIEVLWNSENTYGEADTAEHHIRVWKYGESVYAEIRKVR